MSFSSELQWHQHERWCLYYRLQLDEGDKPFLGKDFPWWFGMAYDLLHLKKILVLWLMLYFTSAADHFIWSCRGISIPNSLKELGKMINSAIFRHCASIILMDSPDPWQRFLTNKQHKSFEALLWNSAGKSFSSSLLMVLAVSFAICFPATDNIKLHAFFLMQPQDWFWAQF